MNPALSIKSAVTYLCRQFTSLKLSPISPEVIRQAKAGGPWVFELLKLAHDLAVLGAAGWPTLHASEGFQDLWHAIEEDAVQQEPPNECVQLLLRELAAQGCPHQLVAALKASGNARTLLIACAWLIASSQLFDGWFATLAAADLVLNPHTMGRVIVHTGQLSSVLEGQLRSVARMQEAQLEAQGPMAMGKQPQLLTPLELWLLAHPRDLQRHVQQLEAATAAMQRQRDCAMHAITFFRWMGSVLEEQQREDAARTAHPGGQRLQQCAASPLVRQVLAVPPQQGRMALQQLSTQLEAALQQARAQLSARPAPKDKLAMYRGVQAPGAAAGPPVPELTLADFQCAVARLFPAAQGAPPATPSDVQAARQHALQHRQERMASLERTPQPAAACIVPAAIATAPSAAGRAEPDSAAPTAAAADESARLATLALASAKLLARARAQNKQRLRKALADLPGSMTALGL